MMMILQMTVVRVSTSVVSAILIGLWVNVYTDQLTHAGYMTSLASLRWSNIPLGLGVFCLVLGEMAARRWRMLQEDEFRRIYAALQQRQRRVLEGTLGIVCELISKTLRIPCNARYFVAEEDHEGRYYLRQDRDLAVLNIRMPREFGFTRIYVDTPHIISGRAFRDRLPVYEDLPDDHSNWYEPEVGRMIEPQQRWVLACPVLRLDALSNSHGADDPPHGVIVFYGTETPDVSGSPEIIENCLYHAQQFAEQMSHVLNMLDLSVDREASGNGRNGGIT